MSPLHQAEVEAVASLHGSALALSIRPSVVPGRPLYLWQSHMVLRAASGWRVRKAGRSAPPPPLFRRQQLIQHSPPLCPPGERVHRVPALDAVAEVEGGAAAKVVGKGVLQGLVCELSRHQKGPVLAHHARGHRYSDGAPRLSK